MIRKIVHLERRKTGEHLYYGSITALWLDNKTFPIHTVRRISLKSGWKNSEFKVRLGALLTRNELALKQETS